MFHSWILRSVNDLKPLHTRSKKDSTLKHKRNMKSHVCRFQIQLWGHFERRRWCHRRVVWEHHTDESCRKSLLAVWHKPSSTRIRPSLCWLHSYTAPRTEVLWGRATDWSMPTNLAELSVDGVSKEMRSFVEHTDSGPRTEIWDLVLPAYLLSTSSHASTENKLLLQN